MQSNEVTQRTSVKIDDFLSTWLESFLIAKKAEGLRPGSLRFYSQKLALFSRFCDTRAITQVNQVTADELRRLLLWLAETDHNPGGVSAVYRTIKCFLLWYWDEVEPEGRNPIGRVPAPRVDIEPLVPADTGAINAMLKTCVHDIIGDRDRAIILFLEDTGVRAGELVACDITSVNLMNGDVTIGHSKTRRPRIVHLGKTTRKALRGYLKHRTDTHPALFVTDDTGRITYDGLRAIITRRAKLAAVDPPSLHSFRRLFCLTMLRNGCDLITLSRMTGHRSLEVLRRYLSLSDDDTRAAHEKGSPVDNILKP